MEYPTKPATLGEAIDALALLDSQATHSLSTCSAVAVANLLEFIKSQLDKVVFDSTRNNLTVYFKSSHDFAVFKATAKSTATIRVYSEQDKLLRFDLRRSALLQLACAGIDITYWRLDNLGTRIYHDAVDACKKLKEGTTTHITIPYYNGMWAVITPELAYGSVEAYSGSAVAIHADKVVTCIDYRLDKDIVIRAEALEGRQDISTQTGPENLGYTLLGQLVNKLGWDVVPKFKVNLSDLGLFTLAKNHVKGLAYVEDETVTETGNYIDASEPDAQTYRNKKVYKKAVLSYKQIPLKFFVGTDPVNIKALNTDKDINTLPSAAIQYSIPSSYGQYVRKRVVTTVSGAKALRNAIIRLSPLTKVNVDSYELNIPPECMPRKDYEVDVMGQVVPDDKGNLVVTKPAKTNRAESLEELIATRDRECPEALVVLVSRDDERKYNVYSNHDGILGFFKALRQPVYVFEGAKSYMSAAHARKVYLLSKAIKKAITNTPDADLAVLFTAACGLDDTKRRTLNAAIKLMQLFVKYKTVPQALTSLLLLPSEYTRTTYAKYVDMLRQGYDHGPLTTQFIQKTIGKVGDYLTELNSFQDNLTNVSEAYSKHRHASHTFADIYKQLFVVHASLWDAEPANMFLKLVNLDMQCKIEETFNEYFDFAKSSKDVCQASDGHLV